MTPPPQGGNALASKPPDVTASDPQATVQIPQCVLAAAIVSAERALTSYWQEDRRHGLATVIEELQEWSDGTLEGGRVAQAHAAFTLGELISSTPESPAALASHDSSPRSDTPRSASSSDAAPTGSPRKTRRSCGHDLRENRPSE